MEWFYLFLAGLCEVSSINALKLFAMTKGKKYIFGNFFFFGLALVFLTLAMRVIPMTTTYAIFTGMGAVGGVILGVVVYKEKLPPIKIAMIGLILIGAIGLKILT